MTWFKVDDKLHDHRKARAAGVGPMGLWVLAGSWCGDNLTDGFVPRSIAARWDAKGYLKLADRLVEAGLWLEAEKDGELGWQFHDWHVTNPLRERVLAERAAAVERQRKAREKRESRRDSHRDKQRESHDPDPTRPPSLTGREGGGAGALPDAAAVVAEALPPDDQVAPPPPGLRRHSVTPIFKDAS